MIRHLLRVDLDSSNPFKLRFMDRNENIHQHEKMRYLSSVEHQMVKYQTLYVKYHFNHINLDIYVSCTDECRYHLQRGVDGPTDHD